MRRGFVFALALAGCNGLFEGNPEFVDTDAVESTGGDPTGAPQTTGGPVGDTAADTAGSGGGSGGESSGAADDEGSSSSSGGACQADAFEFNDDEQMAPGLDGVATMGGGLQIDAVLEGIGAVDWYRFNATQGDGVVGRLKVRTETVGVRICAYVKCSDLSAVEVTCDGNEEASTSSTGNPGCCGVGEARPNHQCGGMPGGDATVAVRVSDAMDRDECIEHTLEYSFPAM